MSALAGGAHAATYVYVSNAEDGEIGAYAMQPDGALKALARTQVAKTVMPMAVSPNRRLLYAASRSKPYTVHVFAIDPGTGALKPLSTAPLAESFPYISLDRNGRFLFGASYGAHLVSVNAVGGDGRVFAEPLQVIPVGRNAHSILVDATNRFVYVPNLGTDQIFQFVFDEKSGRLASNTPAPAQHRQRHLGRGPAPHPERKIPLRLGAHLEHARRVRRRCGEREAHVSLEHADRAPAARIRDRFRGTLPRRLRRKIGNDLRLRDRAGDWSAQARAEGSDGQRRELGGDRRLRLKAPPALRLQRTQEV